MAYKRSPRKKSLDMLEGDIYFRGNLEDGIPEYYPEVETPCGSMITTDGYKALSCIATIGQDIDGKYNGGHILSRYRQKFRRGKCGAQSSGVIDKQRSTHHPPPGRVCNTHQP